MNRRLRLWLTIASLPSMLVPLLTSTLLLTGLCLGITLAHVERYGWLAGETWPLLLVSTFMLAWCVPLVIITFSAVSRLETNVAQLTRALHRRERARS